MAAAKQKPKTSLSPTAAREYLEAVELPYLAPTEGVEAVAEFDFDKARDQAMVVGSDIISFMKGVTEERRLDIVNSALLAQLVAKKKVADPGQVFPWYEAYFEALSNIGWVMQEHQFVDHREASQNFDAHQAILTVATTLLGAGAAALTVVKATLDALKSMSTDSPFITVFNRESQHAHTARFQISLAEQDDAGQFLVSLMAFVLDANADFTQVLFFRFRQNDVQIRHASGKVTINPAVLEGIREPLKQKLKGFAQDYIAQLPPL
jgi:hypothetical protein